MASHNGERLKGYAEVRHLPHADATRQARCSWGLLVLPGAVAGA
jgi:hypothetical protein